MSALLEKAGKLESWEAGKQEGIEAGEFVS